MPESHELRRTLVRDDRAVSEILGVVITFGIAAIVLTGSVVAFRSVQERATRHSVQVEADSVALQVATAFADAAHVAGQDPTASSAPANGFERRLELPPDFAGHPYTIRIIGRTVQVSVPGFDPVVQDPDLGPIVVPATRSLIGVPENGPGIPCDTSAMPAPQRPGGGPVRIVYGTAVPSLDLGCTGVPGSIFLVST